MYHAIFLSHQHYFEIPLALCLLLFPGNWQHCHCVPASPGARQVSPTITEHFPALSHLVISHQLWAGLMDHPAQLCSGKQGMFPFTSQGERPPFGSLHSREGPREGLVALPALSNVPGRLRRALPRDGPALLGNWNSEDWDPTPRECAILHVHIPAFLYALLVKRCCPIFHGLAANAADTFLSLFFFLSKSFFKQFVGEGDNKQQKLSFALTLKSKTWIYTLL